MRIEDLDERRELPSGVSKVHFSAFQASQNASR